MPHSPPGAERLRAPPNFEEPVNLASGSVRGGLQLFLPIVILFFLFRPESCRWYGLADLERVERRPFSLSRLIRWRLDEGQTPVEYAGFIAIVAAGITALLVSGLGTQIFGGVQSEVCKVTGMACPAPAGGDTDVTAGSGDADGTGGGNSGIYCVQQGIINGTLLVPGTAGNLTDVWTQLHDDPVYNVKTAAYLTIYNAYQIGLSRPGLDTSDADSQAILARYNGTNDAAQEYGRQVGGLYQVLEKYYKIVRNL